MGLDINASIEVRDKSQERYEVFANVVFDRDYQFFGLISENDRFHIDRGPPLFLERGLPHNVSLILQEDFEELGFEARSPSWLSVQDLYKVREALLEGRTALFLDAVIAAMQTLNADDDASCRLVFWFQ